MVLRRVLEDRRHRAVARGGIQRLDGEAVDPQVALRWGQHAADELDEGGLPGAVFAHKRDLLALADGEVDAVEHVAVGKRVAVVQVLGRDL